MSRFLQTPCLMMTSAISKWVLPLSSGSAVSSTSPPVLYLEEPWLFFCFFFNDRLANGSIRSTNVPLFDMIAIHFDCLHYVSYAMFFVRFWVTALHKRTSWVPCVQKKTRCTNCQMVVVSAESGLKSLLNVTKARSTGYIFFLFIWKCTNLKE